LNRKHVPCTASFVADGGDSVGRRLICYGYSRSACLLVTSGVVTVLKCICVCNYNLRAKRSVVFCCSYVAAVLGNTNLFSL